jgi:hypothetical protein
MKNRPSICEEQANERVVPRDRIVEVVTMTPLHELGIRCGLALLVGLASCRPSSGGGAAPVSSAATADTGSARDSADAGAPPAVQRACTRDEDCAVTRVEVTGPRACCPACATTPGTRRWHADLQRYCASRSLAACAPLACPEGPTRAVCREGLCEATPTGPDGGPVRVRVEQQCLPAMLCDTWKGCAIVTGNAQDGWFVEQGEQVPRGAPAVIGNVCTVRDRCEAARVVPEGVSCPPWTVPPRIEAPPYTCVLEDGQCRAKTSPAPPAASRTSGELDVAAGWASLTAAASNASSCKQPGDPGGTARVQVTLAPTGRVTSVRVNGPPYEGTATGGCLERAFRAVTVPAFSGGPVAVSVEVALR